MSAAIINGKGKSLIDFGAYSLCDLMPEYFAVDTLTMKAVVQHVPHELV